MSTPKLNDLVVIKEPSEGSSIKDCIGDLGILTGIDDFPEDKVNSHRRFAIRFSSGYPELYPESTICLFFEKNQFEVIDSLK